MSIGSKLFGIWAVNKTVTGAMPFVMRLLVGMMVIVACAIIAAVIIAMMVVGVFWLLYEQLSAYGLDSQLSALIIGSLLLALLGAVIMHAKEYYRRMKPVSRHIFHLPPAVGGRLSRAVDAFMEGFDSTRPLR